MRRAAAREARWPLPHAQRAARACAGQGGRAGRRQATCSDAGALGLTDLVIASEAATFAAVDARSPWPSAFLEWIVLERKMAGRPSTLLTCGT